jgi:hypothetical protein
MTISTFDNLNKAQLPFELLSHDKRGKNDSGFTNSLFHGKVSPFNGRKRSEDGQTARSFV